MNAVTLENFEEPIRISIFVKDLFVGFSMVRDYERLGPSPSIETDLLYLAQPEK